MAVVISKQIIVPIAGRMAVSDIEVGSSVFLNVGGVKTEFLVIHQGLPSSIYDSSCDGTWLLMKDTVPDSNMVWYDPEYVTERAIYHTSEVHNYLTNTFPSLIDTAIISKIKTVKIPYVPEASVSSGSNGLSTKFFELSTAELGWTAKSTYYTSYNDGACLQYFEGAASTDSRRIAYDSTGTATYYWTRSPEDDYSEGVMGCAYRVTKTGYYSTLDMNQYSNLRPAFVLDSSAEIDTRTFEIVGQSDNINYIESTGTQYINTGITPNQDTRFVIDFETLEVNGETHIASVRHNASTPVFTLFFGNSGTYGTRYGTSSTAYVPDLSGVGRHVFDRNKNVLTVDGNKTVSANYETFDPYYTLTIFARNDGTSINGHIKGRLYSCQIYDNDVLVRDFVPSYGTNGKACLYDKVTKQYFYNAGTGEFIVG